MVGKKLGKCVVCNVLSIAALCLVMVLPVRGDTRRKNLRIPPATLASPVMPKIDALPASVYFPNVPVGDTYSQMVRLTNRGANVVQVKQIKSPHANVRISGTILPFLLAPGTSSDFTVSFHASAEGHQAGQILVVTNSSTEPFPLEVRASAVANQTELSASESSVQFNDVAVGATDTRELLLTNSGNRDLSITGISLTGAGFSVSGIEPVKLSPGQNVHAKLCFTPRSAGASSGSLTVLAESRRPILELPVSAIGATASDKVVTLKWEDSQTNASGYMVYRSTAPSGPYAQLAAMSVPSPQYTDSGLAAGRTYYYVVTTVDAENAESEYSEPISATIPES